jgi:hypothetical protein
MESRKNPQKHYRMKRICEIKSSLPPSILDRMGRGVGDFQGSIYSLDAVVLINYEVVYQI